jgi:predicted dinucleotide-utilizing enzyme
MQVYLGMGSRHKTLQVCCGAIVGVDGIQVLRPVAVVSTSTVYPLVSTGCL